MLTHSLGFSRMGRQRELKKALEKHWRGELSAAELLDTATELRRELRAAQRAAGIEMVAVGDHSLYDQILDMSAALGVVPERVAQAVDYTGGPVDLRTYFLMARGGEVDGVGVAPLEMSKWFDTNYHYLVPEFSPETTFRPHPERLLAQIVEAREDGGPIKVVLPGPLTYLASGKSVAEGFDHLHLLAPLVAAYAELLAALAPHCDWIQLDEPILATDLPGPLADGRFRASYTRLVEACAPARLLVATCFGSISHNLAELAGVPLAALHLDLVRAPEQLNPVLETLPVSTALSLGLVNGRNIWRVEAQAALALARPALERLGQERLLLAPSCSLLHVPVDLTDETALDPELKSWMAFGLEKCAEVRMLADALAGKDVADALAENAAAWSSRRAHPATNRQDVRARTAEANEAMESRPRPYNERRVLQADKLGLPLLPTTTIGSFPQTKEIRAARRSFTNGTLDEAAYTAFMRDQIADAVTRQEALDLDVLVHGEAERNDMVEYFGEQLDGVAFTQNGWVQSYGSRCVKPPVIYGDVSRPEPMTVAWSAYAQSLTDKPMKGMLTGPVTILCWSFVRDDQPRDVTCRQIALAVRDEVLDLEGAGLPVIQVDEPALREGAPLRAADRDGYYRWAVAAFRLSCGGAAPATQIHTHMCYSEFNEMVAWIAAMDADVISIEASRSRMELLEAFRAFSYPYEIGPGVYDIHSPRVPSVEEICELLRAAAGVIAPEMLWVNPDCGLKTRGWPETTAALENMVEAARIMRRELAKA